MKRIFGLLLAALMALSFATAYAQSPEENVYYAIALKGDGAPVGSVSVAVSGASFYLLLPEGSDAPETYFNKGVRIILDAPVPDGGYGPDEVVVPLLMERVGLIDGEVIELGEDYIVSYVYQLAAVRDDAPQVRIAITEETYIVEPLAPGDFVEIFYDEQMEMAFEIWLTRG